MKHRRQYSCLALTIGVFAACNGNQFRMGVSAVFASNVLQTPAVRFEPGGAGERDISRGREVAA